MFGAVCVVHLCSARRSRGAVGRSAAREPVPAAVTASIQIDLHIIGAQIKVFSEMREHRRRLRAENCNLICSDW